MDNELLRRVERVERENRFLNLAGLLLLVFVGTVAAVQSQMTPKVLTVQKVVITDQDGANRGQLSADKNGGFLLSFPLPSHIFLPQAAGEA